NPNQPWARLCKTPPAWITQSKAHSGRFTSLPHTRRPPYLGNISPLSNNTPHIAPCVLMCTMPHMNSRDVVKQLKEDGWPWPGKRSSGTWALVKVDTDALMGPAERINITIPRNAPRKIDAAAQQSGLN